MCCTHHRCLTFSHWSGVTPYTSSYEFAGSCVFGKQLPGILSLRPLGTRKIRRAIYFCVTNTLRTKWEALFRSYGCFFAEFLGEQSLVRLTLLELTTCVGLRYGFYKVMLREFSRKRAFRNYRCLRNASPFILGRY